MQPQTLLTMRVRKVALRLKLIRAGRKIGFLPRREKTYLHDLICLVAPEDGPTQDALEWGVMVDGYLPRWQLTRHPELDAQWLATHQDAMVARYRAHAATAGMDLLQLKIAA